jgi:hypothetical protein
MSISGEQARDAGGVPGVVASGGYGLLARREYRRDLYEERAREVWMLRGERAAYLNAQHPQADVAAGDISAGGVSGGGVVAGGCLRRRVLRGFAVGVFPVSVAVVHVLDVLVFVACLAIYDVVASCLERRSVSFASVGGSSRAHDADDPRDVERYPRDVECYPAGCGWSGDPDWVVVAGNVGERDGLSRTGWLGGSVSLGESRGYRGSR